MTFNHQQIESRVQERWEKEKPFQASDTSSQQKFYVLVEFPYPSGEGLHVGHCRSYTALDIVARQARMQGRNVLFPIGFDAFGLPTENFAIKNKIDPQQATAHNIKNFTRQLKRLGFSFDFSRCVNTTEPEYFKWTQALFLKFLEKDLAYQAEIPINWCPSCRIGLANEEVVNGKCERCSARTTRKVKKQWMLRITAYAERLLQDLETVDFLPRIKTQQQNWIGQSEGAEVEFRIASDFEFSVPTEAEFAEILKIRTGVRGHTNGFKAANFIVAKKGKELAGFAGLIPDRKEAIIEGVFVQPKFRGHKLSYQILTRLIAQSPKRIFWLCSRQKLKQYYQSFGFTEVTAKSNFFEMKLKKNQLERAEKFANTAPLRNFAFFKFEKPADFEPDYKIKVFTTRPDTLFGCTFLVLSPEHQILHKLKPQVRNLKAVEKYCARAATKSDLERTDLAKTKTGVPLSGVSAVNPVNQERVPIFVADYVLSSYGTGAIMSVPAHDERDYAFAQKFGLPIRSVVAPKEQIKSEFEFGRPTPEELAEVLAIRQREALLITNTEPENFIVARQKKRLAGAVSLGLPKDPTYLEGLFVKSQFCHGKLGHELLKQIIYVSEQTSFVLNCRPELKTYYQEFGFHESKKIPEAWRLKLKKLLSPAELRETILLEFTKKPFTAPGISLNSGKFSGLPTAECKRAITKFLTQQKVGKATTNYKLRDWVFSRQRYWGEPIPVVHCQKCGVVPLKLKDLPLELPRVKNYAPTGDGSSPLVKIEKWVKTRCPKCARAAQRETDTMPNWAGSSWYFLRYIDPQNKREFANFAKLKKWLPVDLYNGGMEHTVLHLLYSRFWHKFLFDCGLVPTAEPYAKRISHGMILGSDGEKMSKSRGNVVNPDEIVAQFGADTLRIYEMFIGPFEQAANWNEGGVVGCRRFLEKVWRLTDLVVPRGEVAPEFQTALHQTIQKVSQDIENFHFNTAVACLMNFVNQAAQLKVFPRAEFEQFLKLLAPFAPHLAEIIWREKLQKKNSLQFAAWPKFEAKLARAKTFTLAIAVNGKLRATLEVPAEIAEAEALAAAKSLPNLQKWLQGKRVVKTIFVPKRMLNFVVQ